MRFIPLFVLLLFVLAVHGKDLKRVAILNTEGEGDLTYLSVKLREIAVKILPKEDYSIMTAESIIDKLGSLEKAKKVCKEAECIAQIGRKVSADYVCQARVGNFGSNFTITMELYISGNSSLVDSFTGEAKDLSGLLAVIDKKAPEMFRRMPGVPSGKSPSPSVEGGISGLQKTSAYEADDEKLYVVNLSTEPSGAIMSFDGVPATSCPKTPCKAELAGGNVRIIAALEQYEKADTTVFIKQNKQNISIKLKPNFGILEIKPAYLDGIGQNTQWNLSIDGKPYSLGEVNLSPNKYSVKLSHECYGDIGFNVGINKGKRDVWDMAGNISLKKGGLTLSAERNGEPVNEPVFVNGKNVGETPFSGSVPLCARVEIGKNKEIVDVKLRYNEKIKHTHKVQVNKFLTDARDGKKYKIVTIGTQTWMAENLNYNANGSICFNCDNYGRSYDWSTAKTVCPKGWHLPSKAEWEVLMASVGGNKTAGKFLKATIGWNNKGNGTDAYGFSAYACCSVYFDGRVSSYGIIGDIGYWWSSSEYDASNAYNLLMFHNSEYAAYGYNVKNYFYNVRCLQD